MKQPKPMVGQTWDCDVVGGISRRVIREVIDHGVYHADVFFECANHMDAHCPWEFGVFVPQNDLEWLAVNLTVWKYIFDGMRVFKQGSEASFTSHDDGHQCMQGADAYTRQQWQDERYRLGLDTKPHYKLINGQWSKTNW